MVWEPESCVRCSVWFCPAAIPGILSGVILSIGRIVGETAALIYTAGSSAADPLQHHGIPDATLAVHMYNLSREGLYTEPGLRQRRWYFCSWFCLLTGYQVEWVVSLCHSNSAE